MPAEDPKDMEQNSVPPPEGGDQTQNESLMGAEKAIEDDLGGSTEPTDKQKEAFERKVEEARERRGSY